MKRGERLANGIQWRESSRRSPVDTTPARIQDEKKNCLTADGERRTSLKNSGSRRKAEEPEEVQDVQDERLKVVQDVKDERLKVVQDDHRMEFLIQTTWDNRPVKHKPVKIAFQKSNKDEVIMEITAPFFNDPPSPDGKPGEPFHKLWDYEVVEAFFLGKEEKYLEVEFSPHGQHLLLLLSGAGNAIKMCLPVEYKATITGEAWHGVANIPASYFPPSVYLFNAYAIHGSGDDRVYESLYPVPTGHFENPNFHRLEFFRYIEFYKVLPSNPSAALSSIWKGALKDAENKVPLKC